MTMLSILGTWLMTLAAACCMTPGLLQKASGVTSVPFLEDAGSWGWSSVGSYWAIRNRLDQHANRKKACLRPCGFVFHFL